MPSSETESLNVSITKEVKIEVERLSIPKKRRKSSESEESSNKKFKIGGESLTVNWEIDHQKKSSFCCVVCRKNFKDAGALAYHEIHHPELFLAPGHESTDAGLAANGATTLTSVAHLISDHPLLQDVSLLSPPSSSKRRVRVKSFLDEKVVFLADATQLETVIKKEVQQTELTKPTENNDIPTDDKIPLTDVDPVDLLDDQMNGDIDPEALKSLKRSQFLKNKIKTEDGSFKTEPIKIVKVSDAKWKVDRSPDSGFSDLSSRQKSDVAASKSRHHTSIISEPEVLRYVKMPKRSRNKQENETVDERLKILNEAPNFFDEDDFDIVMEGPEIPSRVQGSETPSRVELTNGVHSVEDGTLSPGVGNLTSPKDSIFASPRGSIFASPVNSPVNGLQHQLSPKSPVINLKRLNISPASSKQSHQSKLKVVTLTPCKAATSEQTKCEDKLGLAPAKIVNGGLGKGRINWLKKKARTNEKQNGVSEETEEESLDILNSSTEATIIDQLQDFPLSNIKLEKLKYVKVSSLPEATVIQPVQLNNPTKDDIKSEKVKIVASKKLPSSKSLTNIAATKVETSDFKPILTDTAQVAKTKRKSRFSLNLENPSKSAPRSREASVSSEPTSEPGPDRRFSERRFKGEKPYICNHCPLTFSSLENRVIHERTHKEKPFECAFCEMRFSFELSLKRHIKIHR